VRRQVARSGSDATDKHKDVRLLAVNALAWFPEAATGSASLVPFITRGQLVPEELANAILYLGNLDRYLPDYSDVPWLREQLSATRPYLVLVIGPFPVPSPRDKRERNDDPGQKRRGHRYSVHPSNHTISIDYPDRRSVNYLDHSQHIDV
jgi:hypothetical protein